MKRAILIATGTVGGLGAVLAITPPTFTSADSSSMALPGAGVAPAETASTPVAATPTETQSAAPSSAATKAAASTKSSSSTKSGAVSSSKTQTPAAQNNEAATPTPTPSKSAAKKAVSGTFTGDSIDVRYGFVQVKITVENGKITDAQAVVAPSGRNDRWTQMSVPVLRQRTLEAQSANISGVTGASFTSYGWYTSLVSALAKAGM